MYKILSFGERYKTFKTYKELLYFLKEKYNFINDYRHGAEKLKNLNTILCNACYHTNDKICTSIFEMVNSNREYHERQYMFIDSYDRIMDIDKLAYDSYNIESPKDTTNFRYLIRYAGYDEKRDFRNKRDPIPYRHYYRSGKTANELRANSNPEHKPFVRGKRTNHCLDQWNIEKISWGRKGFGWKQFKRVKKQYMIKVIYGNVY